MITFLRRIRQRLLSENKFSRYLLYAIGEITLVMIGILLALQVNNWNENRINSTKEQEYLVGLKNDLEKQIQTFKGRDQFYDFIINEGENILVDFSEKGNLTDIDSINRKLSVMMFSLKYPDIRTSFNELNTTGQLNLIENKSLRSSVIRYYQNSEESKQSVNSNIDQVYYGHVFPYIKSSVVIHSENLRVKSEKVLKKDIETQLATTFKNNLSNPSTEFELINAISLRIIVAKTNQGSIQRETENAELLLNEIKNCILISYD